MEIIIVISCGLFMMLTAAISYYRLKKDFDNALKDKKKESKQ